MKVSAQAPGTDFSATPTSGCGPLVVQFTDQSSNGPLFWAWDFGNGLTSRQQNPTTTYTSPGSYTVTLIARNKDGANAMRKTGYITVFPYPTAQFGSNLTLACAPADIQFNDQSTPGQGSITSWSWTLGDGSTSNQQNPTHAYSQTGYYTISLKVTNSGGCSNTQTAARYLRVVDGVQPNFNYQLASASCIAPFLVNFIDQTAGPGTLTYNWTLGNGATPANSNSQNPSGVTYPASGSYNVSLQVQSSLGCSQTVQKTLSFNNNTAVLNGPDSVCVNSPATFTNGSAPPPASMAWNFGDGTTAKTSPATKTWSTIGSYSVKLVNRYATCADSTTKTVSVVNPPTAAFMASPTSACKPSLTVNFTDQSTGGPTSWLWDFGDGQTSTQQSPSHTYTTSGTFDVKLTVSSASNCSNTMTKTGFVTIKAPTVTINGGGRLGACIASYSSSNTVNPTATVNTVDNISGYNWSAPGSNEGSSTATNPSFTYNTQGNYTISVTVTTSGGCTATGSAPVAIGTPTTPSFTISSPDGPASVCGRHSVKFTASGIPADSYSWNFGDGDTATVPASQTAISHTYSQPFNPATVTLTLSNHGCPTTASNLLVVKPPFPKFGYKVNCPAYNSVTFIDSSLVDAGASNYTWNFGDGSPAQTTPPNTGTSHIYPTGGAYPVILGMSDGACATQFDTVTITLAQVNPVFVVIGTPPGNQPTECKHKTFELTSQTTTNPNPPTAANFIRAYVWQITKQPSDTTTAPTFATIIDTNGVYNATLTTIDINGCTNTSAAVPIRIIGPTAHFNPPSPDGGCMNSPTSFTENSALDPAGANITTWNWNFGDNQSSSQGPTTTHAFTDTGYYFVHLTVIDNNTCSDTYTQPGPIQITSPQANFAGPDSFYCPGVPLNFIDSSQGYGLTENWSYGDGNSGSIPTHTYATPGQTYNVTLKVTDKYNCTNSITKTVNIQKPVAAFDIADTTAICTPLQTQFTSRSQYYDSLYWNFGDGSTSTLPVTSHFYNTYDTFTAKLYVQGPGGCLDSASHRILVLNPNTTTQFSYIPLQACDSVYAKFTIVPPGYTTFTLQYGDLTGDSSGNNPSFHMYRGVSTYRPILTLTDATGCVVTINGNSFVTVLGAIPFFTADKHAFCDSSIVNFTDYTITNDGFSTETYSFSDGSPSQTQSPGNGQFNVSNDFTRIGTWLATLKVTTTNNCTESYTDTIKVFETPHPAISISSLLCAGMIQFDGSTTNQQVDSITWAWNFGNSQTSRQQNPSIHMDPGSYTVILQASTALGCTDTVSDHFTINPIPVIKGPKEITTPLGIPVTLPFTYSSGIVSYTWTPATNLDCPTCPNPIATLILSTQYEVTVSDSNKCTASDTILVKTLCTDKNYWLPNTFSPNGDGVNDYFYPRGTSLYNVQSFTVFNRWGQMVFQRKDFPANTQSMGWDGNFNGRPAPADAYVYIVEVVCDNAQVVAIHGSVTLVR
ncbi:hypothetical protein GCM10011511_45110 [Puia dinghuensis]|uniref:PKD domain-containing protein n=2 Tax=Puia dinghuensis TaxID=1792502 RepID=A0A8J2XTD0_9BACT|nr:hypothetical protein GCM10011511_45110 [Puia dinghuensis]